MAAELIEAKELPALLQKFQTDKDSEGSCAGLTPAQICQAYEAALSDFVCGKTTRAAVAEISRLLAGALVARRQAIAEDERLNSQRIMEYY